MSSNRNQATAAAARILGCDDTITASDPKVFVAGLVDLLAMYPPAVIEWAADPARGLPALVKFPNLASFREQLEKMLEDYDRDMRRERHRLERESRTNCQRGRNSMIEPRPGLSRGFSNLDFGDRTDVKDCDFLPRPKWMRWATYIRRVAYTGKGRIKSEPIANLDPDEWDLRNRRSDAVPCAHLCLGSVADVSPSTSLERNFPWIGLRGLGLMSAYFRPLSTLSK